MGGHDNNTQCGFTTVTVDMTTIFFSQFYFSSPILLHVFCFYCVRVEKKKFSWTIVFCYQIVPVLVCINIKIYTFQQHRNVIVSHYFSLRIILAINMYLCDVNNFVLYCPLASSWTEKFDSHGRWDSPGIFTIIPG